MLTIKKNFYHVVAVGIVAVVVVIVAVAVMVVVVMMGGWVGGGCGSNRSIRSSRPETKPPKN